MTTSFDCIPWVIQLPVVQVLCAAHCIALWKSFCHIKNCPGPHFLNSCIPKNRRSTLFRNKKRKLIHFLWFLWSEDNHFLQLVMAQQTFKPYFRCSQISEFSCDSLLKVIAYYEIWAAGLVKEKGNWMHVYRECNYWRQR